ncbi:FAD-dependent monooxygenase [Jiangella sp. DSM 45060]|uniref:FAD-dependent monooxygenase n=1 Tax=Jiangella sp. DSM 45060 TaxID=1798224 RepID=UPI00087D9D34|nr:FAD-dependent monooxygenase [Jiangella sp. DSM 45060]SDT70800.1 2-polyprenyl-6-methoxyphenol hydroxylase [Jiangella sp. DSM 45060]HEU4511773.1 FAD-dependent monooxygenase [Nocardioidaceae bacterium]
MRTVSIVGGGIGGLVLALELERHGIRSRIYEAAPRLQALGVGINVLPHASAVLAGLGLEEQLTDRAVLTREAAFFNRFGQHIFTEPAGRWAGHEHPQYSIHRGDLHSVLVDAVRRRCGDDAIVTNRRLERVREVGDRVELHFIDDNGDPLDPVVAESVVGCDGIHSVIRRTLHPDEGPARYSGVMMWRGVAAHPRFLSGATMVRAGWLQPGKLVTYPIRNGLPGGLQLVNWVAEIEMPRRGERDWQRRGRLTDFADRFADWRFDWLDVPELLGRSEQILEYPMVDQDPLPFWSRGRLTLLGDAAHPMVPRGSNGAGQAILDAAALARILARADDPAQAFAAYEDERLQVTAAVVRMNRAEPPDAILRTVYERSGDAPVRAMSEIVTEAEAQAITGRYLKVATTRHPAPDTSASLSGAGARERNEESR